MVTVGVALGLFADSFAGLRLLGSRAYRVGDTIEILEKNIVGVVISTTLFGTTLQTEDGSQVLIPNQMIFNNPVKNRSTDSARGIVSLQLVVKPKTSIDDLQKMILEMIPPASDRDDNSMGEILVKQIEQDAVTLNVRFMTRPGMRKAAASEFLKTANTELKRNGVEVHSLAIVEA
jgi:small conductance mechanosensitive channel